MPERKKSEKYIYYTKSWFCGAKSHRTACVAHVVRWNKCLGNLLSGGFVSNEAFNLSNHLGPNELWSPSESAVW